MDEYGTLLPYFSGWMRQRLEAVPEGSRPFIREIRLRLGQPVVLTAKDGPFFLSREGRLLTKPPAFPERASREELLEILKKVCGYSLQSCQQELAQGYYTLPGGHRVGIAGTVSAENGRVNALWQPLSLNFRIARQLPGAAGDLPRKLYSGGERPSVLIAGVPSSGKTTLLRDLIRRLSMGETGRCLQIAAVDERGELGGGREQGTGLDLGPCTDLLSGYPKGAGMEIALRTLAPDILACDEIGGEGETAAILSSAGAGVPLLATAHGESFAQIARRPALRPLLEAGIFDRLVLLGSSKNPGAVREIIDLHHREEGTP